MLDDSFGMKKENKHLSNTGVNVSGNQGEVVLTHEDKYQAMPYPTKKNETPHVPDFKKNDYYFPGEQEAEKKRYQQEASNCDLSEMNVTTGTRPYNPKSTLTGKSMLNDTDSELNFALSLQRKKAEASANALN